MSFNSFFGIGTVALTLVATANALTLTPMFVSFSPGTSITYSVLLDQGEVWGGPPPPPPAGVPVGDGFTLFDIEGFNGFGTLPADWVATTTTTGSAYGSPGGTDSALTNVTFTYVGVSVEANGTDLLFQPFTVLTTATSTAVDDWVSRDHTLGTIGVIDGTPNATAAGTITVPSSTGVGAVPDGGNALALWGAALAALGLIRSRFGR